MRLRPFIPVLIIGAGVLAYYNSFQGPFIFDDIASIPENPHIRHLFPLGQALSAPACCAVTGRPVVCLTLALNYALGGLQVWGYHAFNLLVHVGCALVLFGILRRTLEGGQRRAPFGAAAVWLALAITLLWEVHPLQTESVNYIVQRSDLLMGLFLLLTIYATLRGSESSRPGGWYLAAVVCCALGMGSKEVMVTAPVIVLMYDRVFVASSFRELWRRRGGLYVGMAATWLLLATVVHPAAHPGTGFGIRGLAPWDYLKSEANVVVYYLRLCVWPRPLVIDYADWPIARSLKDAVGPGIVVVLLLGLTAWAFRRRPWLGFLGSWFFLILAPTSSLLAIAGEMVAERRMYLPLAAVVTIVAIGAYVLGKRLLPKRPCIALGCLAAVSVTTLLMSMTIQRNRDYRSALSIWQDAVQKRPNNARAHSSLGAALDEGGRAQEAMGQYVEALRLKPDFADAHLNLGGSWLEAGNVAEAVREFEQALRLAPQDAVAHYDLGVALQQQSRIAEAISQYEEALKLQPGLAEAQQALARVRQAP